MKEDETLMYVFNADPSENIPRISIFRPDDGRHFSSYFFKGADLYRGQDSYSYHLGTIAIDPFN